MDIAESFPDRGTMWIALWCQRESGRQRQRLGAYGIKRGLAPQPFDRLAPIARPGTTAREQVGGIGPARDMAGFTGAMIILARLLEILRHQVAGPGQLRERGQRARLLFAGHAVEHRDRVPMPARIQQVEGLEQRGTGRAHDEATMISFPIACHCPYEAGRWLSLLTHADASLHPRAYT